MLHPAKAQLLQELNLKAAKARFHGTYQGTATTAWETYGDVTKCQMFSIQDDQVTEDAYDAEKSHSPAANTVKNPSRERHTNTSSTPITSPSVCQCQYHYRDCQHGC